MKKRFVFAELCNETKDVSFFLVDEMQTKLVGKSRWHEGEKRVEDARKAGIELSLEYVVIPAVVINSTEFPVEGIVSKDWERAILQFDLEDEGYVLTDSSKSSFMIYSREDGLDLCDSEESLSEFTPEELDVFQNVLKEWVKIHS